MRCSTGSAPTPVAAPSPPAPPSVATRAPPSSSPATPTRWGSSTSPGRSPKRSAGSAPVSWARRCRCASRTKFDDVADLLRIDHQRRTRVRFSVNAPDLARRFDGGTAPLASRLTALRAVALAGYPVGLTIAPVMAVPGWREGYGTLLDDVAAALAEVPDLDLTAEVITHRFTPASKEVLLGWYPQTRLEMDEDVRSQKRSRVGGVKYVYPRSTMAELRSWFSSELPGRLPSARFLYWT